LALNHFELKKDIFMKYLYLSIFLLALSCGGVKSKGDKEELKSNKAIETTAKAKKIEDEKLLVVLKNPNNLADVKELIKNSGLTWDKMAFENDATKIGSIKVPADKKEFWLDRLKKTGEFESVSTNNKTTLDALIKKAKAVYFSFRKTECFGDCPVYNVSIDKKGNVTYTGLKYVTETGERKFTLTEKELTTLNEKLANNNFTEYKNVYDDPNVMDLPSTFITHKEKQVQIRLWKGIPKSLIDVHEYVQGLLLDKKFFE